MLDITPTIVIAFALTLISLFLDYFPGVSSKFDAASEATKKQITLLCAVAVTVVAYVLSCTHMLTSNLICSPMDVAVFGFDLIVGVATMYGWHKATKPTASLKARLYNK